MKIATTYPCCAGPAHFAPVEYVPAEKYDRTCSHCGKKWTVTRTLVRADNGIRVDTLEWEADR